MSAAILCLAPSQEIVQIVFFSSVFASMPLLPLNQRGERFVLSVKFGDERIEVRKFWGNGYSVPVKDLHHVALHTCEYKGIRHRRLELHLGHNILRINGWQFATGRMEVAEALIRCYGRNSRWAHLPEVQEYVSLFGQVTSSAGPAYDDRGDEIPAASTAGAKPQRWKRRGGRLSSRARIQE